MSGRSQDERTADATTGLHKVPYYWAGVFVREAARFLCPAQHFALIDNDCVPITLLGRPSVATPVLLVFLDPKMKATNSPENAI